jgi:MFS family permease
VLLATSLGVLIAQTDTSVVSLAVKSIGADLGSSVSEMQWVIDAYNLIYATLLLTGGTLGDLYGRRRIFVCGIALFTLGTIICALAPNGATLIAGRAISGLGAALELPMSLVLLALAYPEEKSRAHVLGIWASCNGLAFIIGPTIGGFLVYSAGWRSIFYLILPACAAALILTYAAVDESSSPRGRKLDITGQVLAIAAIGGLAFAVIEGSHWDVAADPEHRRAGAGRWCRVFSGRGAAGRRHGSTRSLPQSGIFVRSVDRRVDDVRHVCAAVPRVETH